MSPYAQPGLVTDWWPLVWTVLPRAGSSPISVWDLAELRATVDVLRLAGGLEPVAWDGAAAGTPALLAYQTRIRAVHFTQLHAAIDELWRAAGLDRLPEFSGGPIVAGRRLIRLSDVTDLRDWIERYENTRPDLAARTARRVDASGRTIELWDASGAALFSHNPTGEIDRIECWIDGVRYIHEPSAAPPESWVDKVTRDVEQASAWLLDGAVARHGAHAVRADGRGRPIAVGDPACPDVRVAYDADGRVAKVATPDALWHVVGDVTIDVASPPGQAAIDACHTPTAATRWDRAEPATARIETSKSDGVDVASRIARSPAGGWSALGRLIPWWRPR